jgi:hypothetical protein
LGHMIDYRASGMSREKAARRRWLQHLRRH